MGKQIIQKEHNMDRRRASCLVLKHGRGFEPGTTVKKSKKWSGLALKYGPQRFNRSVSHAGYSLYICFIDLAAAC